jgi:tetratricopeptide (TPR) repeat protein
MQIAIAGDEVRIILRFLHSSSVLLRGHWGYRMRSVTTIHPSAECFTPRRTGVVKLLLLTAALAGVTLAAQTSAFARPGQSSDEDDRQYAVRGLSLMMDGDLDGAVQVFEQIQHKDPQSPVGFVLEANATWWKIYYDSANLIDPDVFDVANMEATPYDSHFDDLIAISLHKAEARIHAKEDLARSNLYAGFAFALRARLEGLHDRDLPTARAGKKMRTHLLRALELDPSLSDAYLGVGIYNYFVDTLPGIVKVLSIFIGLPGGSRTEGLKQLQLCAEKGELARAEAKFYLAKDFSRSSEKQYQKSLHLFQELAHEFPHNPLWPTLAGSLEFRLDKPQQGDAIYREVYQKTAGKNSAVDVAVHHATGQALERLHPGQKFP